MIIIPQRSIYFIYFFPLKNSNFGFNLLERNERSNRIMLYHKMDSDFIQIYQFPACTTSSRTTRTQQQVATTSICVNRVLFYGAFTQIKVQIKLQAPSSYPYCVSGFSTKLRNSFPHFLKYIGTYLITSYLVLIYIDTYLISSYFVLICDMNIILYIIFKKQIC